MKSRKRGFTIIEWTIVTGALLFAVAAVYLGLR